MFKKFFAKLMGFESAPKPGSAREKFQQEQQRESELAEERRQANLRRVAEKGKSEDVTKETENKENTN